MANKVLKILFGLEKYIPQGISEDWTTIPTKVTIPVGTKVVFFVYDLNHGGYNTLCQVKQAITAKTVSFALNDEFQAIPVSANYTHDSSLFFSLKNRLLVQPELSNLNDWVEVIDSEVQLSSTTYFYSKNDSDKSISVQLSDCIPNWGGKHPLAHIWQALRAFTARKAVNA